jgi:hypothetical protein
MAGHILVPTSDPVEDMAARLALLVDGMNSMVVQEDVDVAVKTYPAAVKPPRATVEQVTDPEHQLRLIPRQDLSNLPRVQKGLHSRAIRHVWLAEHQERIISNMHQELDRFLRT